MTRMRTSIAFLVLAFMFASFASAQQIPYSGEKRWGDICDKAKSQPLEPPSLDCPIADDQLPKCNETALYYGFDGHPDYACALQCGWYQRAHPQEHIANMFYGPGVLTMLYANGLGTRRNYDLAIRFACEQPWAAETEQELRIGHLEYLRDTGAQTRDFNLCDDITSGLNQGACASVEARAADAKRALKIARITKSLKSPATAMFPALQQAEDAFERARIETEIDLSGTARAAFQFDDETKLRDQFVINLERFGRGDVPKTTSAELAKLDRQMNAVYRQIEHAPQKASEFGTVKPEGIRKTQRAWLKLADTWIRFGRTAYPSLSAERIRAQLIRLRLHQLRSLAPSS